MLKTLFHGSLRYRFATFNASADDLALRCFVLEFLNRCRIATTLPADTRRVLLVVLARTI